MEKHFGFMCAALSGLIATNNYGYDNHTLKLTIIYADAALAAYEERWKGEGV